MRNIKAKKATKKEIEFFCSKIPKLEIFDFLGLAKLCGVQLVEPYDPETVPEDFKPVPRDFYDMLADLLDYYQNAKKETRQFLVNIVLDCERINKKNGGKKNGTKPEDSIPRKSVSA